MQQVKQSPVVLLISSLDVMQDTVLPMGDVFCCSFYAAKCRNINLDIFIGTYAGMGCNGATGGCNIAIGHPQEGVELLVLIIFS